MTDDVSAATRVMAAMAEFSLQTGLRRANVTHLEWSQVDLARKTAWVTGNKTKNGKAQPSETASPAGRALSSGLLMADKAGKDSNGKIMATIAARISETS